MANANPVTIVLADDHEILLDGIGSILAEQPWLRIVGKAASAEAALALVEKLQPALLITDVSMGERSGQWLTEQVSKRFPLMKIMVLSMHEGVQHIHALLEAGADAYLLKSVKQDELLHAIGQVMKGERYLQQSIAGTYTRGLRQHQEAERQSRLSPREIEVLRLVVEGLSSADISARLFLSELTVETHRKNIGRKTGAKNAISLVRYAQEHGLL
ncbi:response regulator [Flaviaesturariibacter flavus]|uniref:response regulator n=1 Tax=Flaviaesturariibacter flavus TaxID=2502780 RepID=UPI0014043A7B|nr:response regulator transcription factor [Flaviaesturariibacter flavus]